jgi:hypothetical protein
MYGINIRHDLNALEARLAEYPKQMLTAAVRAQNRTISTLRKEGAKRMAGVFPGIKSATLKRQMRMQLATSSAPQAKLSFSGNRFRLFGNVPLRRIATKWGTGVRLGRLPFRLELADGTPVSQEMFRRFFLQRARSSGVVNVWVREGTGSVPFQAVVAPSLAHAFREQGIGDALVGLGRVRFQIALKQEMNFRLALHDRIARGEIAMKWARR